MWAKLTSGTAVWMKRFRSGPVGNLVERLRDALPYLPMGLRLPDGPRIRRHFGDRHSWRIVEEICVSRVYESVPGFGPQDGETVIDIGAHIGVYAVTAAMKVGREGRVIAVEADPRNFRLLSRNTRRLGFAHVRCVRTALWRERGMVVLNRDPTGFGAHSLIFHRGGDSIVVPAETLDDLVRRLGLTEVSLLKMDVEGAATDVLEGARTVLERFKPRIACAAYHTPDEVERLSRVLEPLGYRIRTNEIRLPFAEGPEVYLFASVAPDVPLT